MCDYDSDKKHRFQEKATDIILSALYDYANPIDLFSASIYELDGRKSKAIYAYQNDPMTKTRVDKIVSCLLAELDGCLGRDVV